MYSNASPVSFRDPTGMISLGECMATIGVMNILAASPIYSIGNDNSWFSSMDVRISKDLFDPRGIEVHTTVHCNASPSKCAIVQIKKGWSKDKQGVFGLLLTEYGTLETHNYPDWTIDGKTLEYPSKIQGLDVKALDRPSTSEGYIRQMDFVTIVLNKSDVYFCGSNYQKLLKKAIDFRAWHFYVDNYYGPIP